MSNRDPSQAIRELMRIAPVSFVIEKFTESISLSCRGALTAKQAAQVLFNDRKNEAKKPQEMSDVELEGIIKMGSEALSLLATCRDDIAEIMGLLSESRRELKEEMKSRI